VSKRIRLPVLAACLVSALSICTSASAAVITIGSPMTASFSAGACNTAGGCTLVNLGLIAPGPPLISPVSGEIVRWRVEGASALPGYTIRVLGGAGPTLTGAGTSAPVTPAAAGVETFGAGLPINAGERIGLNVPHTGGIDFSLAGGMFANLAPELPDGQSMTITAEKGEVAFNADVRPAPTVSVISPATGPSAGGTSVVIAGSDFVEVQGVFFGGTPSALFTVNSEGQITALAPASSAAGAVDITVTTVAGRSPTSSGDRFSYTDAAVPIAVSLAAPTAAPAPRCVVPKLTGRKLSLTKKKIRFAGCRVGLVSREHGVSAKTAKVVRQVPKAGKVVAVGTKVSVKLGG
jgi:hypothetical protein